MDTAWDEYSDNSDTEESKSSRKDNDKVLNEAKKTIFLRKYSKLEISKENLIKIFEEYEYDDQKIKDAIANLLPTLQKNTYIIVEKPKFEFDYYYENSKKTNYFYGKNQKKCYQPSYTSSSITRRYSNHSGYNKNSCKSYYKNYTYKAIRKPSFYNSSTYYNENHELPLPKDEEKQEIKANKPALDCNKVFNMDKKIREKLENESPLKNSSCLVKNELVNDEVKDAHLVTKAKEDGSVNKITLIFEQEGDYESSRKNSSNEENLKNDKKDDDDDDFFNKKKFDFVGSHNFIEKKMLGNNVESNVSKLFPGCFLESKHHKYVEDNIQKTWNMVAQYYSVKVNS